jgi:hypothetical protein
MNYTGKVIMDNQEKILHERRANCKIWAHLIFWWIVPFGWIISSYKMRYGVPVYVMLGAICFGVVTLPNDLQNRSDAEIIEQSFVNGQKYGIVGGIIGSAITVKGILESRKKFNKS